MKTCNLSDFMKALTPWLDDDYIRKAYMDDNGHFVLLFADGVKMSTTLKIVPNLN